MLRIKKGFEVEILQTHLRVAFSNWCDPCFDYEDDKKANHFYVAIFKAAKFSLN